VVAAVVEATGAPAVLVVAARALLPQPQLPEQLIQAVVAVLEHIAQVVQQARRVARALLFFPSQLLIIAESQQVRLQ
jgi:hypothetical protein